MIGISFGAKLTVTDLSRSDLEALFHLIGQELDQVESAQVGLLDHAVSVDLGQSTLEVEVTTVAESAEKAEIIAKGVVLHVLNQTGGEPVDSQSFAELVRSPVLAAGVDADLEAARSFEESGIEILNRELVAV